MLPILHIFASKLAHNKLEPHTHGGRLDVRFGYALLRDRRVPASCKLMALGIGGLLTALCLTLELPLESVLAFLLPFLGLFADATVDGLEIVIGPLVIGALLLPLLAPRELVEQIRHERFAAEAS